ncbi:CHRD domain-containing protein [Jiangella alkaliphila]|uniref:CHRD domain-containing protein n=1 Tax=Jiangella alkaliphila TaxID=419479 RepID=A0A1H2KUD5_9ACTN|nr:CHRD domain-containing protein [Jiangella alkaliphila]SDU72367.1 CHRD domain-containing protein [Jiangella alkaliphila]
MRNWLTRSAILVLVAATALVAGAAPASSSGPRVTPLVTTLSGAAEVPGPGDADGRGAFAGFIKGDTLCYAMLATRIDAPTMAHIHVGPPDVAGPIVVHLRLPTPATSDCIRAVPDAQNTAMTLSQSELAAIVADRRNYYVNVHNTPFPAGAVRGQFR